MLTRKEIIAKAKSNLEGQWGTAVVGGMLFIKTYRCGNPPPLWGWEEHRLILLITPDY